MLVGRVTHAGGYYKGNCVKLLQLAPDVDRKTVVKAAAARGFSLHPAPWVFEGPGGVELEAFQRKEARSDKTANPPNDILVAAEKAGVHVEMVRASASGYRLFADNATEAGILKLAEYLDSASIALKKDGVFVRSREQTRREKDRYWDRIQAEYGVVGVDRFLGEYEVRMIMGEMGIFDGWEVEPVYGMGKGKNGFVIRGLSDDQEAALQRAEYRIMGRKLQFGKLANIVEAEADSSAEVVRRGGGGGTPRSDEMELLSDGETGPAAEKGGETRQGRGVALEAEPAGTQQRGRGGRGRGGKTGRVAADAAPATPAPKRMLEPGEGSGATPPAVRTRTESDPDGGSY
ncbi:hypothetical protein DIPPA_24615 [Diplonema papillatum]|nr:hypothetical protein DIPPA_24615 [Diplonema papillatum]